jgi:methionine sulfoxide reductase heme-binding subunit
VTLATIKSRRLIRLRNHVAIAFLLCAVSGILFVFLTRLYPEAERQIFRWSLTTGYVALAVLAVTLSLGVWNVVRGRRNPVSSDVRRDLGIWCAFLSLVHVIVGLNVHMKSWTLYFVQENGWPRADLFGGANYLGAVAALLVVILVGTSNDYSIRQLGRTRWKTLQRFNYLFFILVMLHSLIYAAVEKRFMPYVPILILISAYVLVVQYTGFRQMRMARQNDVMSG